MPHPNLPALWTALRSMFALMYRTIGAGLAERASLEAKECKRIRAWIAPVIAMARKVVLIEALALAREAIALVPKTSAVRPPQQRTSERAPSLRLWPKPKRPRVRIRQLGPPVLVREVWREQTRAAQTRHLNKVRCMRASPGVALSRRIDALARLIREPQRAIRRLARKLRTQPKLALLLASKRPPRTSLYRNAEYGAVGGLCFDLCVAHACPDTS